MCVSINGKVFNAKQIMGVNILRVIGIYPNRKEALQKAGNQYGETIGYLPIKEGKWSNKVTHTSLVNPDNMSDLGKVVRHKNEYYVWVYSKCHIFRFIERGDIVEIFCKGKGKALIPNIEEELWVCEHGIASRQNIRSIKKSGTYTRLTLEDLLNE